MLVEWPCGKVADIGARVQMLEPYMYLRHNIPLKKTHLIPITLLNLPKKAGSDPMVDGEAKL